MIADDLIRTKNKSLTPSLHFIYRKSLGEFQHRRCKITAEPDKGYIVSVECQAQEQKHHSSEAKSTGPLLEDNLIEKLLAITNLNTTEAATILQQTQWVANAKVFKTPEEEKLVQASGATSITRHVHFAPGKESGLECVTRARYALAKPRHLAVVPGVLFSPPQRALVEKQEPDFEIITRQKNNSRYTASEATLEIRLLNRVAKSALSPLLISYQHEIETSNIFHRIDKALEPLFAIPLPGSPMDDFNLSARDRLRLSDLVSQLPVKEFSEASEALISITAREVEASGITSQRVAKYMQATLTGTIVPCQRLESLLKETHYAGEFYTPSEGKLEGQPRKNQAAEIPLEKLAQSGDKNFYIRIEQDEKEEQKWRRKSIDQKKQEAAFSLNSESQEPEKFLEFDTLFKLSDKRAQLLTYFQQIVSYGQELLLSSECDEKNIKKFLGVLNTMHDAKPALQSSFEMLGAYHGHVIPKPKKINFLETVFSLLNGKRLLLFFLVGGTGFSITYFTQGALTRVMLDAFGQRALSENNLFLFSALNGFIYALQPWLINRSAASKAPVCNFFFNCWLLFFAGILGQIESIGQAAFIECHLTVTAIMAFLFMTVHCCLPRPLPPQPSQALSSLQSIEIDDINVNSLIEPLLPVPQQKKESKEEQKIKDSAAWIMSSPSSDYNSVEKSELAQYSSDQLAKLFFDEFSRFGNKSPFVQYFLTSSEGDLLKKLLHYRESPGIKHNTSPDLCITLIHPRDLTRWFVSSDCNDSYKNQILQDREKCRELICYAVYVTNHSESSRKIDVQLADLLKKDTLFIKAAIEWVSYKENTQLVDLMEEIRKLVKSREETRTPSLQS